MKLYVAILLVAAVVGKSTSLSYSQCPANLDQILLTLNGCEFKSGVAPQTNGQIQLNYVPMLTQLDSNAAPILLQMLQKLNSATTNPQNQQAIQLLITSLQNQQTTGQYNNNLLPLILSLIQQIQSNPNQPSNNIQLIIEQTKGPAPTPGNDLQALIASLQNQLNTNPLPTPGANQQLIDYLLQLVNALQNNPQQAEYLSALIALIQKLFTPNTSADQLQATYSLIVAVLAKLGQDNPNQAITIQQLTNLIQTQYLLLLQRIPSYNTGLMQQAINFVNLVNMIPIPGNAQSEKSIQAIISNDLFSPTNLIAQRGVQPNVANLLLEYLTAMSAQYPSLAMNLQNIANLIRQIYVNRIEVPGGRQQLFQLILNYLNSLQPSTQVEANAINALISLIQQWQMMPVPEAGWDIKLVEGFLYLLLSIQPVYSQNMNILVQRINQQYVTAYTPTVTTIVRGGGGGGSSGGVGLLGRISTVLTGNQGGSSSSSGGGFLGLRLF